MNHIPQWHVCRRGCVSFFSYTFFQWGKKGTLYNTLLMNTWRRKKNCVPMCTTYQILDFLFLLIFFFHVILIFCIVLYNFVRLWYFLLADFVVVCFTCMMIYFCQCIHYFSVKMLEPSWQKQYCGHWLVIITVVIMIISSCSSSSSAPTDEWLFSVSFILYLKARFRQTNERSNLN